MASDASTTRPHPLLLSLSLFLSPNSLAKARASVFSRVTKPRSWKALLAFPRDAESSVKDTEKG